MADIKTRDAVKGTIKTIDKAAIASERMKAAYAKTKDKAEQGYYADENSATEYATDRVSYATERVTEEGLHQFNKQGQKGLKTTQENIGKAKDKIADFKQKRAAKVAEQNGLQIRNRTASRSSAQTVKTGKETKKTIKQSARSTGKTVKTTAKGSVKTAEKSIKTAKATSKATIKTAEQTAKATKAAAKASAKAAQRAAQVAKATAKATVVAVKSAVKATIAAVKAYRRN